MNFRNAASFGKRQEYIAVAELLRRHFDVYMTLVDDQQIDCVIRQEKEGKLRYLDIQIKARSSDCAPENAGTFAAMEIRLPRENFFFIFYSEQVNIYWIIPSLQLIKEANKNKQGKNRGKYSIKFCSNTKRGPTPRPRFKQFEYAFHFLEWKPEEMLEIKPLEEIGNDIILKHIESLRNTVGSYQMITNLNEISKLVGKTLYTLKDNRSFLVLDISEKKMFIRITSSGKERSIDLEKEIKSAFHELRKNGRLTRKEIEIKYAKRNPAYVAAILAQIKGVRYTIKPIITLFLD